jgi:site-specific recombinase XerD
LRPSFSACIERSIEVRKSPKRAVFNLATAAIDPEAFAKPGSCHLFRRTMATLMLEGGADIRYVQQMLGHTDISSTQIYTRVSLRALEAVHSATHPGAANEPRGERGSGGE